MNWLRANIMTAAALVLAVLLAMQTWRLHTEQLAHRDLIAQVAQDEAARASASLKQIEKNATKKETHATASQENANELLEELSRQRDAAVAGAARAERLRNDAERRSATYRAMSEAGAAACSALADRTTALDRQLAEGLNVVADLRGVVERRDAEVKALMGQIDADRALFAQPNRPDGGTTLSTSP